MARGATLAATAPTEAEDDDTTTTPEGVPIEDRDLDRVVVDVEDEDRLTVEPGVEHPKKKAKTVIPKCPAIPRTANQDHIHETDVAQETEAENATGLDLIDATVEAEVAQTTEKIDATVLVHAQTEKALVQDHL